MRHNRAVYYKTMGALAEGLKALFFSLNRYERKAFGDNLDNLKDIDLLINNCQISSEKVIQLSKVESNSFAYDCLVDFMKTTTFSAKEFIEVYQSLTKTWLHDDFLHLKMAFVSRCNYKFDPTDIDKYGDQQYEKSFKEFANSLNERDQEIEQKLADPSYFSDLISKCQCSK